MMTRDVNRYELAESVMTKGPFVLPANAVVVTATAYDELRQQLASEQELVAHLRIELAAVREERDKLKDWNERQANMLSSERGTLNDWKQRATSFKQQLADIQAKLAAMPSEIVLASTTATYAAEPCPDCARLQAKCEQLEQEVYYLKDGRA